MPTDDGAGLSEMTGLLAVLILVAANGFFVAAEFSLVAVRRSRVAELVAEGRANATALQKAIDHLDSNLAATQLGITISSLALGWIGEPALAHLIAPLLAALPASLAMFGSHAVAVAVSFTLITVLHIVLGELAPKSLALQRSEGTALWVARPLGLTLMLFRPAILALNGLGNLVLRLVGLQPGAEGESLHSPEELKLLAAASEKAGLLQHGQQDVVARVLTIGDRRIADVITHRRDVEWIDLDDPAEDILRDIRACRHEQILVGRGAIDEPLGMILKRDLLDQLLAGEELNPAAALRQPLIVHEGTPIFKALEQFKLAPVRLVMIVNEYGGLEGIATQTDLLEALAGELPDAWDDSPAIVTRDDGSLLIDGATPAHEAFARLDLRLRPEDDFHTLAGFALSRLGHLPDVGESFVDQGWRFEIVDLDGRRIDKILASRLAG